MAENHQGMWCRDCEDWVAVKGNDHMAQCDQCDGTKLVPDKKK
jgi:Zn finger protein HypA/HybF involved in hydrogenase expression